MIDYTDEAFKHFCALHNEAIVSGRYLNYGAIGAIGDFIMVTGGAGRPKYGLVQDFVSKHRVTLRMLLKRGKKGDGVVGNQICNLGNLIHLHTPINN